MWVLATSHVGEINKNIKKALGACSSVELYSHCIILQQDKMGPGAHQVSGTSMKLNTKICLTHTQSSDCLIDRIN